MAMLVSDPLAVLPPTCHCPTQQPHTTTATNMHQRPTTDRQKEKKEDNHTTQRRLPAINETKNNPQHYHPARGRGFGRFF